MLNAFVVQYGQCGSYSYAVVGSKSGAVAHQPTIFHKGLDGLCMEIKFFVPVFLTHHIHVGLETNTGSILISFVCGFANQHIAYLVGQGFIAMFMAELLQKCRHAFFVLGGTGNIHQFPKVLPYGSRLQILEYIVHVDSIFELIIISIYS